MCIVYVYIYMIMSLKLFLNTFFLFNKLKIIISQIESIMKNYEIMYIYICIYIIYISFIYQIYIYIIYIYISYHK